MSNVSLFLICQVPKENQNRVHSMEVTFEVSHFTIRSSVKLPSVPFVPGIKKHFLCEMWVHRPDLRIDCIFTFIMMIEKYPDDPVNFSLWNCEFVERMSQKYIIERG